MRRALLTGLLILGLAACKPAGRDEGSGMVPPADAPANPAEPASAPSAAPASGPDFGGPIDANGTEPFWGLKLRRDSIVLSRPDHTDVIAVNPGPERKGDGAVWRATAAASGGPLVLTLKASSCSDGMSDKVFTYEATVEYGGETLKGCAEPARIS